MSGIFFGHIGQELSIPFKEKTVNLTANIRNLYYSIKDRIDYFKNLDVKYDNIDDDKAR